MIKTHSDDPDVLAAASEAAHIVHRTLVALPAASTFDYGGHHLELGAYGLCEHCTVPIAEAQAAASVLRTELELINDETVKEHLELAAQLFQAEADAATVRAKLHNGQGSEAMLNDILGFVYERKIADDYQHSHNGGTI